MKTLLIGFSNDPNFTVPASYSSFGASSPYGFDTIIVETSNLGNMLGANYVNSMTEVWVRWRTTLERWLSGNHRIIVMMQPWIDSSGRTNYNWLPIDGLGAGNFIPCGLNNYVGRVVASNSFVKQFLKSNNAHTVVTTHFKDQPKNENILVNSKVDDHLYTSLTIKRGDAEIIFIPQTSLSSLSTFIGSLGSASNKWKVLELEEAEEKANEIDGQISNLESQKEAILAQVSVLNNEIADLISNDVYLSGAIKSYDLTQGTENPEPDNFYEAVEAIENAFKSEREMRESLNFSKSYIDKIMRRTNEFRHKAKSGEEPEPLTDDEITEFTQMTEKIISSYISYLR